MTNLVAQTYADEYRAGEVLATLQRLRTGALINARDVVSVLRATDWGHPYRKRLVPPQLVYIRTFGGGTGLPGGRTSVRPCQVVRQRDASGTIRRTLLCSNCWPSMLIRPLCGQRHGALARRRGAATDEERVGGTVLAVQFLEHIRVLRRSLPLRIEPAAQHLDRAVNGDVLGDRKRPY